MLALSMKKDARKWYDSLNPKGMISLSCFLIMFQEF